MRLYRQALQKDDKFAAALQVQQSSDDGSVALTTIVLCAGMLLQGVQRLLAAQLSM